MKRMTTIWLVFMWVSYPGIAQLNHLSGVWGSHLEKANQLFNQKLYEESIIYYQKELDRFGYNQQVVSRMGEAYSNLGNYKKADDFYTLLFAAEKDLENEEYMYNYAEALTSTGRYEMAKIWYNNYLSLVPDDLHVKNKLEALNHMNRYYMDSGRYKVTSVSINSDKTELGAVPYKDGLLFSSAREQDLIIRYDYLRDIESFLDLYFYLPADSSLEQIKLINHSKSNDGPVAVGIDQLIIARNIGYNENLKQNTQGLFFFEENSEGLKKISTFKYNNPSYSITHPAISDTQDTLFFTSNMPGGFGNKDLYFSVKEGKKWGPPINMGNIINTPGDEVFPFSENGKFYFSSNGHPGLGGLDVFTIKSRWEVTNLGFPINSGWDDFGFNINENQGYFTSNRPGGYGHDDIYHFTFSPPVKLPPAVLQILIVDSLNTTPVQVSSVKFLNKSDSMPVYSEKEKTTGVYEYQLERFVYDVIISSPGFESSRLLIDMQNRNESIINVRLMPDIKLENMNLDSILFDYNDYVLSKSAENELLHIVELMNKYKKLDLEISAYTDSRGETDYNMKLSEMRAASAANHLKNQGIEENRIIILGFGESQLLNECTDGVKCNEEQHSVNRRIEFKLTPGKGND